MGTFRITEEDYVAASQLFARITKRRVVAYLLICALGVPVAFAFLDAAGSSWALAGIIVVGGCIGGELGRWFCVPFSARKIYRQQRALHSPIEFSWSESGVTLSAATGTGTTPWEHYRGFRESRSMFILLLTDSMYHMVPNAAFSGAQEREAFRAMVQSRVGR